MNLDNIKERASDAKIIAQNFTPKPLHQVPNIYSFLDTQKYGRKQRKLYEECVNYIDVGQPLPNSLIEDLVWYPKILELLLQNPKLPQNVVTDLAKENPQAAFNSITSNYTSPISSVLELTLFPYPEYVCKLLLWANINKKQLRYPTQMYLPVVFNSFYWAHYLNLNAPINEFFDRMLVFHYKYQSVSAAALLLMRCINLLKEFNAEHIELIATDEETAFQTAFFFDDLPYDALLSSAIYKPTWAYFILDNLLDKISPTIKENCEMALQMSPPWYLLHLITSGKFNADFENTKQLFESSLIDNPHVMSDYIFDLINWTKVKAFSLNADAAVA